MNKQPIKKILAISLTDKKKFKAYAVFNGEMLVIQSIVELPGQFLDWKKLILDEVAAKKKAGFYVIVEEKTDHIAGNAIAFDFEEIDLLENRIHLYLAFDWYFTLYNMGAIIFPKNAQKFVIRDSLVDKKQDEKGRTKYDVDWSRFGGGQRVVLLTVMAAMYDEVSGNYLDAVFGADQVARGRLDPLSSFKTITAGVDGVRTKEIYAREEKPIAEAHEIFWKEK